MTFQGLAYSSREHVSTHFFKSVVEVDTSGLMYIVGLLFG